MADTSPIKDIQRNAQMIQEEIVKRINYQSPSKTDLDFYQRKLIRLENQLQHKEDELQLIRHRLRKAEDFQIKFDQLVKQNKSVNSQNQKLSKELQVARLENQKLKDDVSDRKLKQKTAEDLFEQTKRQNQNIKHKIIDQENKKSDQFIQQKNQVQSNMLKQIQRIKTQNANALQKLESELRKAKKEIAEKNIAEAGITAKLQKVRNDKDQQIRRLSQLRDQLKQQILSIKAQNIQELQRQRKKYLNEQAQQGQNFKQQTDNLRDLLSGEIQKFKRLLDFKNEYIDKLVQSDVQNKQKYQTQVKALIFQINELRDKCQMMEKQMEVEAYNLKERLLKLFDNERDKQNQSKNSLIDQLNREIDHLKKQLGRKDQEIKFMHDHHSQKGRQYEKELNDKLTRIREVQSQKAKAQDNLGQQIKGLRGSISKIEQQSQNNLMQKMTTIQFLEQNTKLLNLSNQHKNREISAFIKQMDQMRKQHSQTLEKLIKVKEQQRNNQNKETTNLRNDISRLEFQLQELRNKNKMLQHARQIDRANAQSQRRSYQNTIKLLKNQQKKMMEFAKALDQRLLTERNRVGDGITEKGNLDRQRTGEIDKGKKEMQRVIFSQKERMKKQMAADKFRSKVQLAKVQKQKQDLKKAYDQLLKAHQQTMGDKDKGGSDYQRKMGSIQGQIKITQNWVQTMHNICGRIP